MSATRTPFTLSAEERTTIIEDVLANRYTTPQVEALYFAVKRRARYVGQDEFQDILAAYTAEFIQRNHSRWQVRTGFLFLAEGGVKTETELDTTEALPIDYAITDTLTGVTAAVIQPYVDDAAPPQSVKTLQFGDVVKATKFAEKVRVPLIFAMDSAGWVEAPLLDMMWSEGESQINEWGTVTTAKRITRSLRAVFAQQSPASPLEPLS